MTLRTGTIARTESMSLKILMILYFVTVELALTVLVALGCAAVLVLAGLMCQANNPKRLDQMIEDSVVIDEGSGWWSE
jgi:hypothetical protein